MILATAPDELGGNADWESVARALRNLPLCLAGFEGRTLVADWVFLGLWPIGADLEPVITQRAANIAFSIAKRRELEPRRQAPRPHARDTLPAIGRRYGKLAREPGADLRILLFKLRCEVKQKRLNLHRVTKEEICLQLASAYFELTGRKPSLGPRPTRFERLGDAIFDGEPWVSSGKRACRKFSKNVGTLPPR
jgi:hypothetical protein